ncbi:MAG: hypothetical protein ACI92Z_000257, partial [Paracoccaceae bacterium]
PKLRRKLIRSTPQATIINSVASTCSLAGTKGISLYPAFYLWI